jgi:hypothetical protein
MERPRIRQRHPQVGDATDREVVNAGSDLKTLGIA